jgi:hypothetical protein
LLILGLLDFLFANSQVSNSVSTEKFLPRSLTDRDFERDRDLEYEFDFDLECLFWI